MFAIKRIVISDKQHEILNVSLSDMDIPKLSSENYTTLVLGENGVGKSFLLKSIIDIFCFLESAQDCNRKRKPKFQYDSFLIDYQLGCDSYCVNRISGSEIIAIKNGVRIDYKEATLPQKVLAISFMVNDKFQFRKEDDGGIYTYHGVRSSTNSTYTSSIARNIIFDLINCIESGLSRQIIEIFSILQFDPIIEFQWKNNGRNCAEILDLSKNGSRFSTKPLFNKYVYPTIYFYKNGHKVPFESCSSGEKHILFAYIGILNRINDNTLVLIDEPEISLHPEWQIRYVSTLSKLFGKYKNCCFILASHSHYFVSELQSDSSSIVVLRASQDSTTPTAEIIPYNTYSWSAENIIYNVFGVRTSRNFYFEGDLSFLLSSLESFDGSVEKKENIQKQINKLQKYVFNTNDPLHTILREAEARIK